MKKRILSMALALVIAVTASMAPAFAASFPSTSGLVKQRETEHFIFYCQEKDIVTLDDLEESFEGCYERVTTGLGKTLKEKTSVYVYPSIEAYHTAANIPQGSDWSVGGAGTMGYGGRGMVYMTSPLSPGSVHDYDSIITVAVHEFSHVVIRQFSSQSNRVPSYLDEGIACYMAGQPATRSEIQKDIAEDLLPSLSAVAKLDPNDRGRYNAYDYGYAYVDFVIKSFGFDKLAPLLEGKNRATVLGTGETELNELWLAYLKNEYTDHPDAPNLDKADSWARDEISSAVRKGFVPEKLQDGYKKVITREQFCEMAVRYLEYASGKKIDAILAEKELTIDPDAFSDTDNEYILAAYALGITNGTSAPSEGKPGVFSPDGSFQREMAAVMLARLSKALGAETENAPDAGFTDITAAASWAVDGINYCYQAGVMGGTASDPLTFTPKKEFTIQESIATFDRMARS